VLSGCTIMTMAMTGPGLKQPTPPLSRWTVASLVLLGLAVLSFVGGRFCWMGEHWLWVWGIAYFITGSSFSFLGAISACGGAEGTATIGYWPGSPYY
jgi:hypothetical protein